MVSNSQALADFIELGLNQRTYQALRNKLKARNALCLPTYRDMLSAKWECIPDDSILIDNTTGTIMIGMQDVLDMQLRGLVQDHYILTRITKLSCDPNVTFTLWFNIGADSSTSHVQLQTQDNLEHDSIFNSFLIVVSLKATWENGEHEPEFIFLNEMAQSPYGVIYLRMAYEHEDKGRYIHIQLKF